MAVNVFFTIAFSKVIGIFSRPGGNLPPLSHFPLRFLFQKLIRYLRFTIVHTIFPLGSLFISEVALKVNSYIFTIVCENQYQYKFRQS